MWRLAELAGLRQLLKRPIVYTVTLGEIMPSAVLRGNSVSAASSVVQQPLDRAEWISTSVRLNGVECQVRHGVRLSRSS
ncbi:hypothetical protein Fuma_05109 [Fuerstiella marisgermanici]|uniref:Uncharacterized protein n=1 Tax=Fuerstiella marisgermanici TaxID=1891926 RepID=A0A1P8WN27_9PLAN|nr:hypothetical protein Fuma_05109 [Fuerstiella marisgermanici]